MRYTSWVRFRVGRLLIVCVTLIIYFVLLALNAFQSWEDLPGSFMQHFWLWLAFGFSTCMGVMFLAVAILVFLYARDRLVACLLYAFSCSVAATFAVQTSATVGGSLGEVAPVCSALAVLFLACLVLVFPKNHFISCSQEKKRHLLWSLYGYLALLTLICFSTIVTDFLPSSLKVDFSSYRLLYFSAGLIGILVTIIASYFQSISLRARQQIRLFVASVVLAVSAFLFLTVIPEMLRLPRQYMVDGQFTSIALCLIPIALGYSVLRYQILVFDAYIRRTVSWIVGVVCLALLVYVVVAVSTLNFGVPITPHVIWIAVITVVLSPCVWGLSKAVTERLFFGEILHYRRIIEKPTLLAEEMLDLEEASRLFVLAAVHTFETSQAYLFVLDESSGSYRLCPMPQDGSDEWHRFVVFQESLQALGGAPVQGNVYSLDMQHPAIKHIALSRHPLLLQEVLSANKKPLGGLQRYLIPTTPLPGENLLLAPVRAQGKMIGILVLGERGDHQQYAGPDFEIVEILVSRFSSLLENARLYARTNQHTTLLNELYGIGTMLGYAFLQKIEEVACAYVVAAAEALGGRAEIWLYNEDQNELHRVIAVGVGTPITELEHIQPVQEHDWSPWFCDAGSPKYGDSSLTIVPACLPDTPSFPFAWLPLLKGDKRVGILVLTYPGPHFFMKEEMRVLEMFAAQCAAALESARMTVELHHAYEYQKELDRLKDQFIVTASHELRTPLTAVQGYIELLNEYNSTLTEEMRGNFISKAYRGCEELSLLVGNIMDASRVRIDAKNVVLRPCSLRTSIEHVLEIVEGMASRDERDVDIAVDEDIFVMADNMRLRQVLLNLMSNALKYSPPGTRVEIRAEASDSQIKVSIRDYGFGVPPDLQDRLFERFVRLERDLNSPVRGAGLGLFICRQLIEAMGGHIWVESPGQTGEGSTFIFILKRSPAEHVEAFMPQYRQNASNVIPNSAYHDASART